jgi:hypothetical protein
MEIPDFLYERRQSRGRIGLSSIWDPNSRASPVSCWDEEAPQNHRIRTRPNPLVASLWDHHSGDGQAAERIRKVNQEIAATVIAQYAVLDPMILSTL